MLHAVGERVADEADVVAGPDLERTGRLRGQTLEQCDPGEDHRKPLERESGARWWSVEVSVHGDRSRGSLWRVAYHCLIG